MLMAVLAKSGRFRMLLRTGSAVAAVLGSLFLSISAPAAFGQDYRSSLIRAPYSISFGDVTVGKSSDPQTITVLNTANLGGQIDRVTTTGDFIQSTNCPAPPAAVLQNQTCGIEVTFKPKAVGPATGTVAVFHDGSPYPLTVSLSGSGTLRQAALQLSATALNFGEQDLATVSSPQTITLSNPGEKALLMSGIAVTGDFTMMSSSTCDPGQSSLAPGANCTIVIAFGPLKTGKREGQLTIKDDASGSPQVIALTGLGAL
jgi:hypothetical protein